MNSVVLRRLSAHPYSLCSFCSGHASRLGASSQVSYGMWDASYDVEIKILMWHLFVLFSFIAFVLQGFDEYMNLVMDEAEEVHMKTQNRKTLGA